MHYAPATLRTTARNVRVIVLRSAVENKDAGKSERRWPVGSDAIVGRPTGLLAAGFACLFCRSFLKKIVEGHRLLLFGHLVFCK